MVKAICKYEINKEGESTEIIAPARAKPLHLGEQNGLLYLWMEVDIDIDKVRYVVTPIGTGHTHAQLPQKYIGTHMQFEGKLVFHYYIDGPII